MSLLKYLFIAIILAVFAFFAYIGFSDVEVPQTPVVKDIQAGSNTPSP